MDIQPYITPYKYGKPVLVGSGEPGRFDQQAVDCPFVFEHRGRFYMMYVGYDGMGYQTALAVSDDLLHWEHLSVILQRNDGGGWDSHNIAGTWMMRENELDAPPTLKKWDNKYWLVYHAYPHQGYEEGPAKIGLAWTEDENLLEWHRFPEPILVPEEGADWERGGLYKECLVEHEGTFYLFYNAKTTDVPWIEQTGVAFSANLREWTRYEHNPVLPVTPEGWDSGFASDPCVLRLGSQWAMYYFGFDFKRAQEGLALSTNLLDWRKHPEPIIRVGEAGDIDAVFAHKPSVLTHNGVLYHFYCSCRKTQEGDRTINMGNEFRTITVAASHDVFRKSE
jgi:predicted GH43/DUF377 family glycosyl hydrolase